MTAFMVGAEEGKYRMVGKGTELELNLQQLSSYSDCLPTATVFLQRLCGALLMRRGKIHRYFSKFIANQLQPSMVTVLSDTIYHVSELINKSY